MNELFLQFIWRNKLFYNHLYKTDTGSEVEIISVGQHNSHAGPDFNQAKIKTDKLLWVGNVEIHLKSSDWNKHNHQSDKAYQNVILHVVFEADTTVFDVNDRQVPTITLDFNSQLLYNYQQLLAIETDISCQNYLKQLDRLVLVQWASRMIVERLQQRKDRIFQQLELYNGDWETVFFHSISRSMGMGVNADAFEMLARSIPIKLIFKLRDDPDKIEALLFGQAGFFDAEFDERDLYTDKMIIEYRYLKDLSKLRGMDQSVWRFLRLRPASFPTIRISQLAQIMIFGNQLFASVIEANELTELQSIFKAKASKYWKNHYHFGKSGATHSIIGGNALIDSLIINTAVPFVFAFGKYTGNETLCEKALNWLELIKVENNKIVRFWTSQGVMLSHALDSQAILHAYTTYCNNKRCLDCVVGKHIVLAQN